MPRTPLLPALRRRLADAGVVVLDGAGLVASAIGAPLVAFAGKLMLAAVLAALALGFFLRLAQRRRLREAPPPPPAPAWWRPAAAAFAVVETALLTEATDLPVRFHQPGFEPWHWALVLAAGAIAYALHLRLFRALQAGRGRALQKAPWAGPGSHPPG